MAKEKLSDREAKDVLRGWPTRTKLWPPPLGRGFWLRAQPKDGYASAPRLAVPGATMFNTQPDGLWAHFSDSISCDVIVIEVCGSAQNLNDKRSRYMPSGHSLVLSCPHSWLVEDVTVQKGGRKTRWSATASFDDEPTNDLMIPVRNLRVLYALPDWLYQDWCRENAPGAHEFFCKHSSLDTWSSPQMQDFLWQMSTATQFRTRIKAL